MEGSKSLNINRSIATDTIFANMKLLILGLGFFLKKYTIPIAGIASKPIKCTPNERPIIKEISINHLSPSGFSMFSSHLRPSQNSIAIIIVAIAYTSASTALNQKLSEKVKHNDPKKEEPSIRVALCLLISLSTDLIFFPIIVMVRNRKKIVKALAITDIMFIVKAILSFSDANIEKKAPSI